MGLCPGVPCPCPSLPPCTWQQGRAVAEAQLGQFTFMTPKSNKMRIGIDPQVLSRAIKHRLQQTGTAGEPAALGWVPGVCWGMCLWWRWGDPSAGCAGSCGEPRAAHGIPVPWGLAVLGWMELPACSGHSAQLGWGDLGDPAARRCAWGLENGRVGAHSWELATGGWAGVHQWVWLCRWEAHTHTHTPTPDGGRPCTGGHTSVQVRADPQWDKDRAAQRGVVAHTTAQHTGMGA